MERKDGHPTQGTPQRVPVPGTVLGPPRVVAEAPGTATAVGLLMPIMSLVPSLLPPFPWPAVGNGDRGIVPVPV